MIPENSGVGVIAHETGHHYGLPDEYDRTYGGDTSAGFWTIMASGSYGGDGTNGIGNRPVDFDAWDKWQLGCLNPLQVDPLNDGKSQIKLGPAEARPGGNDNALVQDVVRDRARLRLRVRAGVDRRWPDVDRPEDVHRHLRRVR